MLMQQKLKAFDSSKDEEEEEKERKKVVRLFVPFRSRERERKKQIIVDSSSFSGGV